MFFIDGEGFNTKAEYDLAVKDKEIIDKIEAICDLNTEEGIKKAVDIVKTVRFNSKLGDKFDDKIFDLYEKVRSDEFVPVNNSLKAEAKQKPERNKKNKTKGKPENQPIDPKLKEKVKKEIKKQNRERTFLIIILLFIAAFSIGYFIKYYSDARKTQRQAEELNELKDDKFADILKNVTPSVKKEYSEEVVIPDILDEYLALYNKNKSLIGWIKIADTIIDYPVMQTTDNEYYLKHDFNQNKDSNGCIFLDCNCDVILGNDNFILYGHHMKNGKMFSSIIKYANQDFYEEHKTILFDTIYEKGEYEVMYAFRSRIYNADEVTFKYYQFIDANSYEEFASAMEEMANLSLINTGVTAEYGDRLLTLSTCDYQEDKNGRFVVVAKKID